MNYWFTADHHFGHENIIKYTNRPFKNAKEMDDVMIERWNDVVRDEDTVFHLGDFSLNRSWDFVISNLVTELNGNIVIIPGGHDVWAYDENAHIFLDNPDVTDAKVFIQDRLYITEKLIPKRDGYSVPITMCHYPMLSWERSHYGAPHLHGHTHGTIGKVGKSSDKKFPPNQKPGMRIDVGVDNWDFTPISLDKVIEIMNESRCVSI